MPNFENTTSSQESSTKQKNEPITFNVTDSMHEIDALQIEAGEALDKATDYLDNQEAPLSKEKIGLLKSIGKIFKKNGFLKACALATTLMSVQPAFANEYKYISGEDIYFTYQKNMLEEPNDPSAEYLKEQDRYLDPSYVGDNDVDGNPVDGDSIIDVMDPVNSSSGSNDGLFLPKGTNIPPANLFTTTSIERTVNDSKVDIKIDFKEPGHINRHNILSNQIDQYSRRTLRGVTYNGGVAHEIAPGIYSDENTIYRQNTDGSTVSNGGIFINN